MRRLEIAVMVFGLAFMAVLQGCGKTRSSSSPYIPPASDYAREQWEQALEEVKANSEDLLPRTEYLLGPGDVIAISIVGRPDLLGEIGENVDTRARFIIGESPFIVLPYLGAVKAHGKSPEKLQEDLVAAYGRLVKEPIVFVTVEKYHWNQVAVLGSVRTPGRHSLEPGDTLLDVIFKAGGLTLGGRTGDLPPSRVLKIYREENSQRSFSDVPLEDLLARIEEHGTLNPRKEILLPLDTFLIGGRLGFNMAVQPGDIVYVPPAGTVTVHGKVQRPRVVFLGPGIRSLAQVLTEVGGLRFNAASRVEIVRPRLDGGTDSIFVDARAIMKRRDPDVMIEDSDQVFVYTHPTRNFFAAVGNIFRTSANAGLNATYNPMQ